MLDLAMPRMDGRQTLRALRKIRGDIPVILSSGCAVNEAVDVFVEERLAGFLPKPHGAAELTELVERVLARNA